MQHRQREEEEISLLEKKKQREVAKKEFTDDLKFKTTLGEWKCIYQCHVHAYCSVFSLAKNVYRSIFLTKPPERNEFFTAGRMVNSVTL